MKAKLIGLAAAVLCVSSVTASAAEYIYRDLMGNTLPSQRCATKEKATTDALKPFKLDIYGRKFCQTQGYGWHVEEVKDKGKVACNECESGKDSYQCYIEDIVVQCKRIKPGSVGMLPGKG